MVFGGVRDVCIYPFQAIHLSHMTEDTYNARNSTDPDNSKTGMKSRVKRLNVNIIRGGEAGPFSFATYVLLALFW